jgi:hypothetical protein
VNAREAGTGIDRETEQGTAAGRIGHTALADAAGVGAGAEAETSSSSMMVGRQLQQ